MCGTHPMTTQHGDGAGGPFNFWDIGIAKAERSGDPDKAEKLRVLRAKINNAFGAPEKVYITNHAGRVMDAMLAVVKR